MLSEGPPQLATFFQHESAPKDTSNAIQVVIPENASTQEKSIHRFLDNLKINEISVKVLLESQ